MENNSDFDNKGFKGFLIKYKRPLIGGGIGLIVALLLLIIGFFPTLLIVVLTGVGVLFGVKPDLWNKIKEAAVRLYYKLFKKGK